MPGIYRKSREEVRQGMAEGFASFLKGSTAIDQLGTIRFLGENAAVAVSEADRSSLRLAFAAVPQHLSPRQRGALILRDVLGFSAAETAEILGTTAVSVNSSRQRARTRVKEAGGEREPLREPSAAEQRAWIDRYMKAFERADVEGLKRLLTEDVVMEMPPMLNWFAGCGNYGLFMDWVFGVCGTDWRLRTSRPTASPVSPPSCAGGRYEPHTLQVFTVTAGGISRNSVFQGSEVFAAFGLAAGLDA